MHLSHTVLSKRLPQFYTRTIRTFIPRDSSHVVTIKDRVSETDFQQWKGTTPIESTGTLIGGGGIASFTTAINILSQEKPITLITGLIEPSARHAGAQAHWSQYLSMYFQGCNLEETAILAMKSFFNMGEDSFSVNLTPLLKTPFKTTQRMITYFSTSDESGIASLLESRSAKKAWEDLNKNTHRSLYIPQPRLHLYQSPEELKKHTQTLDRLCNMIKKDYGKNSLPFSYTKIDERTLQIEGEGCFTHNLLDQLSDEVAQRNGQIIPGKIHEYLIRDNDIYCKLTDNQENIRIVKAENSFNSLGYSSTFHIPSKNLNINNDTIFVSGASVTLEIEKTKETEAAIETVPALTSYGFSHHTRWDLGSHYKIRITDGAHIGRETVPQKYINRFDANIRQLYPILNTHYTNELPITSCVRPVDIGRNKFTFTGIFRENDTTPVITIGRNSAGYGVCAGALQGEIGSQLLTGQVTHRIDRYERVRL